MSRPMAQPGLTLALADGARWVIRARDTEAARIVSQLGAAMRLQPARNPGRDLLVVVAGGDAHDVPRAPVPVGGQQPMVCILSPPTNHDVLTTHMMVLSLAIARDAQSRGGVLLHGALAAFCPHPSPHPLPLSQTWERGGGAGGGVRAGIILAGPGTVGKTTASERLPPPWRSLCDDATLVVRDAAGQYWAHPWPTWSCFYSIGGVPGPGGSWDVQRAVLLQAIFFLSQSPDDWVEPVNIPAAVAMLMETVQHVSHSMARHLADDEVQALYREQLAAVNALARAIPAYTLHISLSGEFWTEIERVLLEDEG